MQAAQVSAFAPADSASKSTTSKVDSKYQKMYKEMIEKGKKLDEIYKSPNAFIKIFQSETTMLREKVQRYCETLIFREPVEFGRKAQETLWRRVFYEIINIVKQNKKNLRCNSEIETMYRLHLSSAFGFYNHLLLRMQTEFQSVLRLDGFLDFPILTYQKSPSTTTTSSANGSSESGSSDMLKDTLTRILHKFLICLGDLARYQIEYDPYACPKLAYKYYQMTLYLLPSNGTPLNQLGTLFGSENYGSDAAYYYLYCLSCTDPFLSARENLKLLFLKNRKRYEEIASSKYIDKSKLNSYKLNELRTKEIKKFLVTFLYINDCMLANALLNQTSSLPSLPSGGKSLSSGGYSPAPIDNQQLQELCQICLQEFNSVMFYRKPEAGGEAAPALASSSSTSVCSSSNSSLAYLSDELVFKLTVIILMTIEQLKTRRTFLNNTNANTNKQAHHSRLFFTSVAFAHVFFSHIVNHTIIRLQEALLSMRGRGNKASSSSSSLPKADDAASSAKPRSDDDDDEEDEDDDDAASKDSSDGSGSDDDGNPRKSKIKLLFGHRRRKHNSDSDTNESFSSDEDKQRAGYDERGSDGSEDEAGKRSKQRRQRNTNAVKFLERENLSETELNMLSDSTDDEAATTSKKRDSSNSSESGSGSRKFPAKLPPGPSDYAESMNPLNSNFNSANLFHSYQTTSSNTINFKEFSSQLFSSLNEQYYPGISGLPGVVNGLGGTDEFIDNELYKIVLNGGKNNPSLNMLGLNAKEVQEIEELGKKLETFEFDTDTELSLFENSDEDEEDAEAADERPSKDKRLRAEPTNKSRASSSDTKSRSEAKQSKQTSSSKKSQILDLKNAKILISILQTQGLLPTIKVFCDWLLCNKKIIQSISQVPTTVWSKLAVLLNCIPLEKQIACEAICENSFVRDLISKSFETKSWNSQPLSEDLKLRSFSALKLEHLSLKFDINNLNKLSVSDENLLRLCYLRRFGYLIASLSKSQSSSGGSGFFEYNIAESAFVAKQNLDNSTEQASASANASNDVYPKNDRSSSAGKTSAESADSQLKENRKLQLMKSMAQLKLEAEISQLESSYQNDDSKLSPYLVPDTSALCNHLKIVQDLSRMNKFILIIPLIVIDQLDATKKESKQAREAIRWLESQFKQGNRFLRAQSHNERTNHSSHSSLKKKDAEAWGYSQLLECCRFFQKESASMSTNAGLTVEKRSNMVTLLTNNDPSDIEARFKSLLSTSNPNEQQQKIEVAYIREFFKRIRKD